MNIDYLAADTQMRRSTLQDAFDYWLEATHQLDIKVSPQDKMRREEAYLESLCDAMNIGGM
jgi:hypothetical protein